MKKLTINEIIRRFKLVHGDKFDYSLIKYKNINIKVKIICPIHGEFEQTPKNHLKGNDCFECSKIRRSKSNEKFIEQAKLIHNNFYDYSLTEYKNYLTKVKIICPIHGIFEQIPNEHISKKSGCKRCGVEKTKKYTLLTSYEFIKRAKIIHGDKYDYSKIKYINGYMNKVTIICSKHGEFKQLPQDHIHSKAGCPICSESKGERIISDVLKSVDIIFNYQKTFTNLKDKYLLRFDFYIPLIDTCIEFDGEQHFKSIIYWGGEENFLQCQYRDKLKTDYCIKNNISLLRLDYIDYNNNTIEEKLLKFLNEKINYRRINNKI